MRAIIGLCLVCLVAGCASPPPSPPRGPAPATAPAAPQVSSGSSRDSFSTVVRRVEPVAEQVCRQQLPRGNCDFRIILDTRPGLPANAFQTVDRGGQPVLVVTGALLKEMRNADEVAFVLGHEAAHHIQGHIPRTQQNAVTGAVVAGVLVAAAGGNQSAIRQAQEMGAFAGQRSYSKSFELEADSLGTVISYLAGYDPVAGAAYFSRAADPGDQFLGTHPPNADRMRVVRETAARLR